MSKVLTFSRTFPAYHPKAGQPTYFVEKIAKGLHRQGYPAWDISDNIFSTEMYYICEPKFHTIRSGNRWKVGDKFSPRVWSGVPYKSKQITIAPDIEVKKVWNFNIKKDLTQSVILINGWILSNKELNLVAKNDGLLGSELLEWFQYPKPFSGQIICWNENINY